jgi:hypothetical protein
MEGQRQEDVKCSCGNKTFHYFRDIYNDNITNPGTANFILVCAACGKIKKQSVWDGNV